MNKRIHIILLLTAMLFHTSYICALPTYRQKYSAVLEHYAKDTLKYRAALFLVDNMKGHRAPTGAAINDYKLQIKQNGKADDIKQLQKQWYTSLKKGAIINVPDSTIITNAYLIKNIDEAWKTWKESAWKDDVDFDCFCKYILPYRINEENIGDEWRIPLHKQYGGLVNGIKDIKRAFAIVRDSVFKNIALSNPYCEYDLDPITCNIIGKAECNQRCLLLVAVLRALGIPAVIDGTPMWADYSNKGHAWVAMVLKNGDTYTVCEKDSIARQFNPIDASEFLPRYKIKPEDKCPYDIKYTKTPIKIYRICYDSVNAINENTPKILASPFIKDVSQSYGLTSKIKMSVNTNDDVYLCAFLSGSDWAPVAKCTPINGEVTFHNVGKNTVCVLAKNRDNGREIISAPFLVSDNGIEKYFIPSQKKLTLHITRKYPLCSYTTDTWGYMKGGVFEGSNIKDFSVRDTLATINTMPYGMTTVNVNSKKKYRYLRYKAPYNNRSSMAELQFYRKGTADEELLLAGRYIVNGVDEANIMKVFDGNTSTICRALSVGYTIGIDLGENNESSVDIIKYCPSTDLNFVEPGHLYELYYFDKDWILAKRIYSKENKLIFHDMPQNALFLLKDRSGGKEERIFEYVNGKQIWH